MDDFEHLDHYGILGVSRSATADEIKRAYRQQMARFHPDRFTAASAEQQAYASRRAQRINEAYGVLGDFNERTAYNRTLAAPPRQTPAAARQPPQPPPHRDHLAELYEQARAHLEAGRAMQAAATLREIQQLNPFYKDSAALLAQAEAAARQPAAARRPPPPPRSAPAAAPPDQGRRALVAGGLGAAMLVGLGAVGWALRGRAAGATLTPPTAPAAGGVVEPAPASAPPASTGSPAQTPAPPTSTIAPTASPAATLAAPTSAPSATAAQPSAAPTAAASPTSASLPEEGELLYAEDFSAGRGWPTLSGQGWSVGFAAGGYQIRAIEGAGNIWAFSTAPADDFLVGVDVVVDGGLGGLLLRYSNAGYLAFFVDPSIGSYRLERRDGAGPRVLIEEGHPAIVAGPAARNRLVARLAGSAVALRINGQPVYDGAVEGLPPAAGYGMVAVARSAEVVASFADLTIRAL